MKWLKCLISGVLEPGTLIVWIFQMHLMQKNKQVSCLKHFPTIPEVRSFVYFLYKTGKGSHQIALMFNNWLKRQSYFPTSFPLKFMLVWICFPCVRSACNGIISFQLFNSLPRQTRYLLILLLKRFCTYYLYFIITASHYLCIFYELYAWVRIRLTTCASQQHFLPLILYSFLIWPKTTFTH